jgi:hypothetical protein
MQLLDHFAIRQRLYRVDFEWLADDVADTDAGLSPEEHELMTDPCDCGITHGLWEDFSITVLVAGSAAKAADLVGVWVMSDAFTKMYTKSRGYRPSGITCLGEVQLTPADLGIPE